MKFPKINKQPSRSVTVPKLSGGVNLRDAVTMINDNQLTDSKNMWYKDNILKTRPGMFTNSNMKNGIVMLNEVVNSGKPIDIFTTRNSKIYRLFYYEVSGERRGDDYSLITAAEAGMFWVSSDDIITLPTLPYSLSFATQYNDKIYAFLNNQTIYTMLIDPDNDNPQWEKVEEKDIYAPIVYAHCKVSQNYSFDGTAFEGFNLLGNRYRVIYSTVNPNLTPIDNSSRHEMTYSLPKLDYKDLNKYAGKQIEAVITDRFGTKTTHTVTLDASGNGHEDSLQSDGLLMEANLNGITFFHDLNRWEIHMISINDICIEDNLEITAPCPNSAENLKKVFAMQKSLWFGGDAAGISGGTRLFLGGNTEEKEKSLVLWSGLNNPLYFPENCYAYVGNSNQAVTAFGRQNDTLVIFKERETFYTQYTRNSNITASDLINQNVVDYTASSVYFPIVQLHSAIGCDCPDTVELCRNRLVWTCRDGNVYTLITENQFSERNIYCVSDMVKRRLSAESNLKNAHSADWEGHYFLFIGNHAYVMNYESRGYVYASSFNKAEDAQVMIPWWYWEIPVRYIQNPRAEENITLQSAFVSGGNLFCVYYDSGGYLSNYFVRRFDFSLNKDINDSNENTPINSLLQTKIFDFNMPHYLKNVPLINMAFGNNGGEPISVSFVTEQGEEQGETVTLSESNKDEYSPEFVHNRQLRPCVRLINRIGVKAECDGAMSVDSISLDYRVLGGVR